MGIEVGSPIALAASEVQKQVAYLRQGVAGRLKLGLASRVQHYGLRRDLGRSLEHPKAKIPISVRPMDARDAEILFPSDVSLLSPGDRQEVHWRKGFVQKVTLEGGYVAIDERDGLPCYAQWLLGARRNDVIASLSGFPQLAADEALLENAYTPPSHRGLGIMSAAMAAIAERASDIGARYVITLVGIDNVASLKGCHRSGFAPYMVHDRITMFFGTVKQDRFTVMAPNDPRRVLNF